MLNEFEICITSNPPAEHKDDFIVIYTDTKAPLIINGYLEVADKLVERWSDKQLVPSDDLLAIPLLNLYFNALEFTLKFFIKQMIDHRDRGTCKTINKPPDDYLKIITSKHDLRGLLRVARAIMPKKGLLHYIKSFDEVDRFVTAFENFGIGSESTRYVSSKKGEKHKLYHNQSYIWPKTLHASIESIVTMLLHAVDCDEFHYCEVKEFSLCRRDEVTRSIQVMKNFEQLFKTIPETNDESITGTFINLGDLFRKRNETRSFLSKILNDVNKEDLAMLCMGLYLVRHPLTVPNYSYFLDYEEQNLVRTICERAHLYSRALKNAEKHLSYLVVKMEQRGFGEE